jgi:hypothetical protein
MCCLHSVCCLDHEARHNLGMRGDTQGSDSELIFLFLILVFPITLLLITPRQCFILFQFSFLEKATFFLVNMSSQLPTMLMHGVMLGML